MHIDATVECGYVPGSVVVVGNALATMSNHLNLAATGCGFRSRFGTFESPNPMS